MPGSTSCRAASSRSRCSFHASGPAVSDGTLVATKGITKAYDGVVAVDGVDLTIHPGTIVGLVGQNGAGKSTLIKILAGAVTPDAGDVLVDGSPARLAHEN